MTYILYISTPLRDLWFTPCMVDGRLVAPAPGDAHKDRCFQEETALVVGEVMMLDMRQHRLMTTAAASFSVITMC